MLSKNQKDETGAGKAALRENFFRGVARTLKSHKLGDLLVASSVISPGQLEAALQEQAKTGAQLGKILIYQGTITAVQLYHKLAEQWCMKVAATGLTVMMQTALPSPASADDSNGNGRNISMHFTLAAATSASSAIRYPELFGTQETKSNDISAFKKWTDVMQRFEDQLRTRALSPRVMAWKATLQALKGKSPREQIKGVNDFFNQVTYIEDIDNYGKTDYWATPIEFLSRGGDCEDFAIAKYASLRALGFSTDQLRIAIVQDQIRNIPHALLIVYSDAGNFVLDNQDKKVENIASVDRYKPIFSINSASWWLHKA